jgi:hypothetical protein
LPSGSLIKEIQLYNKLLKLLSDYQIPTDQLAYTDDSTLPLEYQILGVIAAVSEVEAVLTRAANQNTSNHGFPLNNLAFQLDSILLRAN